MRLTWMFIPSLLFFASAAACGGDSQDSGDRDGGVVLGVTPESNQPDTQPGDDPLGGDVEEVVRRHLEVEFSDRDWVDDVGEMQQDDEKLTVQMDRQFDQESFDEACTAIVAQAMNGPFGIKDVVMLDQDGDEAMRSRPNEPQCEPVAR